jgi:aryl carrier-like protein
MLRYDVTLIADGGRALADVEGLVFRRVQDQPAPARTPIQPGRGGLSPEEGVRALTRILASRIAPQVIVSTTDPAELVARGDDAADLETLASLPALRTGAAQDRPKLATAYANPADATETQLAAIWAELLGVDRVGRDDNFFELGGDSVVAIQMIARAYHHGMRLTPQHLFRHPTIAGLAGATKPDAGRERPSEAPGAFALAGLDQQGLAALSKRVASADDAAASAGTAR